MKAYLCTEKDKSAVKVGDAPEDVETRQSILFVIKAKNWDEAKENAGLYGAEVVRVLTKKELDSEGEDGSYDIED